MYSTERLYSRSVIPYVRVLQVVVGVHRCHTITQKLSETFSWLCKQHDQSHIAHTANCKDGEWRLDVTMNKAATTTMLAFIAKCNMDSKLYK